MCLISLVSTGCKKYVSWDKETMYDNVVRLTNIAMPSPGEDVKY